MTNKINYIVYSPFPEYVSYIGGATVPHTLANLLAQQGENVYLYANSTKKDYNVTCIPWGTNLEFDSENTVVIFIAGAGEHTWDFNVPDILKNAPNIVRWLVNDQVKLYPEEDKFYTFHKYWNVLDSQRIDGELSVIEVNHDIFFNQNKKREGRCYLIKGNLDTEEERSIHNSSDFCIDSVFYNIPDDQKMLFLAELFNEKEYFISYTPFTFMSVLAAMCGCISIIIPKNEYGGKPFDKEKWKNEIWCAKPGLAVGLEEVPYAIETNGDVVSNVKHYEEVTQTNQIKTFIEDSYIWLAEKYNL
jgi:hypothetical protein